MIIRFDHGLGDCVYFGRVCRILRKFGVKIIVDCNSDKTLIFKACGVEAGANLNGIKHELPHPNGFGDVGVEDWVGSKFVHGGLVWPMPDIGLNTVGLWNELCNDSVSGYEIIGESVKSGVNRFIRGLRRPIVAVHFCGNTWQDRKSLPVELCFDIVRGLLAAECSVIGLDLDGREPLVGNEFCRGINGYPKLGSSGIDWLFGLLNEVDLLIGIDSGPFHLGGLINVKRLGIFYSMVPMHVCLPCDRSLFVVPKSSNWWWRNKIDKWNLSEFNGKMPSADFIVSEAMRVLDGDFGCRMGGVNVIGRFIYKRIGFDERMMELCDDGLVGFGRGFREYNWRLEDGKLLLIDNDGCLTCALLKRTDNIWAGNWLVCEQMPIELVPVELFGNVFR